MKYGAFLFYTIMVIVFEGYWAMQDFPLDKSLFPSSATILTFLIKIAPLVLWFGINALVDIINTSKQIYEVEE